jgi:glutathione synthase/RimK-type ligase-like ATP-grasp enzyme
MWRSGDTEIRNSHRPISESPHTRITSEVLILTFPGDFHAYAVAESLRRKGVEARLWHTTDFPTRSRESMRFEGRERTARIVDADGARVEPRPRAVWNRRPTLVPDTRVLHPADREFASLQCVHFREAFLDVLAPGAFWVNPRVAFRRAQLKMVQHQAALDAGLDVPATLYSNDPPAIRAFLREHGGRIVYKPFDAAAWKDGAETWVAFATPLTEDQLVDDDILQLAPGLYQAVVPKAYELRVTMMGRHAFAARIDASSFDCRRDAAMGVSRTEIPRSLAEACAHVLARLGLVFGCFDFAVDADGRPWFLEVNEMGQFLWVESATGMPLLDAFSEFLAQARVDFDWSEERAEVRLRDVDVAEAMVRARERHVPLPGRAHDETTVAAGAGGL